MKSTILIVDDEPGVRRALSGVLRDEGYNVEAVASGEACLDRVTRGSVDLIVLDVWLPGMDGLATLARLRERQVDAQVVLISGHGNIESAVRAIKMGAFDFIEKPLSLEKTVLVVANAVVRLTVSDNGPGIPSEDRDKLFMPYYSTKRRGSGLGLAIVRRIIAEHGGSIEAGDNRPSGTVFMVELPV